ncbi:pirin family protein [Streptomyces spiramenti]|uniref:Pirin family protein n=1 Tax=Streptomyces spiramenti TaxID=2720606 RepID=A0ABX1AH88_9ACTN|nr:pirin family protein [Streptomyces spiramenti]NJP66518.1 pirin family protein [Streptomyces spiramenti]
MDVHRGTGVDVRRAADRYRGGDEAAGVRTRHAFSFSGFYDPDNLRFGPLTACNEELLAPGAGYAEHTHRDLEIVTWVVEGELTHRDSAGNATVVRPGDLQRLTTGDAARHVERNDGAVPLRFLQMWLVPDTPGGGTEYAVERGLAPGVGHRLPRTDATFLVARPAPGEAVAMPRTPLAHLQVVRGEALLGTARLAPGDEARISAPAGQRPDLVGGATGTELLLWGLHPPAARPRGG